VKVGDLVKNRDDPEVGIGIIIDVCPNPEIEDVLVQWAAPPVGETEVTFWHLTKGLELVSECK
jgi:hypothetical protein